MVAIQDPGKEKNKIQEEQQWGTCPDLSKNQEEICIAIYKKILIMPKEWLPPLDNNENQGSPEVGKVIFLKCKKRGAAEVNKSYRKFALKEGNSVYMHNY